jgi:putative ABC transport system permease protein
MTVITILRTALSSLGANKLRAGLTLLGIVIGVAAVISLMAIGRGVQQTITEQIQSLGTNLLFVRPGESSSRGFGGGQGSAATLTIDDAYALKDSPFAPSVSAVAPEMSTSAQLVVGRKNTSSTVIGVTPEYEYVRNFPVELGQFIDAGHVESNAMVAVLGSSVAQDLYGFRSPIGQNVRINGRRFEVIGVLEEKGGSSFFSFDDRVMIPITTAYYRLSSQRTTQGSISVQTINVQMEDVNQIDAALGEVATVLRLRHRLTGDDDFTVTNQQETIEVLQEATNAFVFFLGAIAGISLLVGGIGIMNIMLVSVTERTREIGIRKAMGAKRRDIMLQFVSEATLLSIGGGATGVFLGWVLIVSINGKAVIGDIPSQTSFSLDIALLALAVSAGIGLFFGIYPAMRAARLHPIEALRYE